MGCQQSNTELITITLNLYEIDYYFIISILLQKDALLEIYCMYGKMVERSNL